MTTFQEFVLDALICPISDDVSLVQDWQKCANPRSNLYLSYWTKPLFFHGTVPYHSRCNAAKNAMYWLLMAMLALLMMVKGGHTASKQTLLSQKCVNAFGAILVRQERIIPWHIVPDFPQARSPHEYRHSSNYCCGYLSPLVSSVASPTWKTETLTTSMPLRRVGQRIPHKSNLHHQTPRPKSLLPLSMMSWWVPIPGRKGQGYQSKEI